MIMCISVLEHISEPVGLIKELVSAAKKCQSPLFISVPFVEKHQWHFADKKFEDAPYTPFFDNDVHVTHFSIFGLMSLVQSLGIDSARIIKCGIWWGVLFEPNPTPQRKLINFGVNFVWKTYFSVLKFTNWNLKGKRPQWLQKLALEI